MRIALLITFMLCSYLFSYQDSDIDGVEDFQDHCPNTSFDKLVDEFGCPQDSSYIGSFTLKVGSDISTDKDYEQINNFNVYLNYNYNRWDLSISNTNYEVLDTTTNEFSDTNDIYISGGYLFKTSSLYTKISLGTKMSTDETDDYFASTNLNYFLNLKQNIFMYYSYSINGDTSYTDYQNTNSLSIGSGYAISNNLYTSLAYEFSSSIYSDGENYSALSWFNSYNFSEEYFATFNYAYALNELSYDHTFSVKLGVYFE